MNFHRIRLGALLSFDVFDGEPRDESQAESQRAGKAPNDRLQVSFHRVADEHVLDVVKHVAYRVHVLHRLVLLRFVLIDRLQQLVVDFGDVDDVLRIESLQERAQDVMQVNQLVFGLDVRNQLLLDVVHHLGRLADREVMEN